MNDIQTPYYVIDKSKLERNINCFTDALEKHWKNSRLSYSVKTNSLPWVMEYIYGSKVMMETVSDEEYLLSRKCGVQAKDIIFNGPIKSSDILLEALRGGALVNLDSVHEVECLKKHKPKIDTIGIRINVNTDYLREEDISCRTEGFRFGFCYENGDVNRVIRILRSLYGNSLKIGFHLHCNSLTRSVSVYEGIARYVKEIIENSGFLPDFLDFGGGYFGGVEGQPDAHDYVRAIKNILGGIVETEKVMLILEPGAAIIGSAVDLHTSVIDVKDTIYSRIVTTDGSRIFVDALWKKNAYSYSVAHKRTAHGNTKKKEQIICGYTCMDYDRIMRLEDCDEVIEGDEIIYHKVGAYSVTFGGPFIRYFPDVYVYDGKMQLVRRRMSVDEYYRIESVGKG